MLAREAQLHGERREVVFEAGHRCGVHLDVTGGEQAGASSGLFDGAPTGCFFDVVEDLEKAAFTSTWADTGTLATMLRQRWMRQR